MKFITLVLLFLAILAIGIDAVKRRRLSRRSKDALANCKSTCTVFRGLYYYSRESTYACQCLTTWYVAKGSGSFHPIEAEKLENVKSMVARGELSKMG
jgi:hypothetical protein